MAMTANAVTANDDRDPGGRLASGGTLCLGVEPSFTPNRRY